MSDTLYVIRPYLPMDVLAHWDAVTESVTDLQPWLPWCHPGYTLAESAAWVLSRPQAALTGSEISFVVQHAVTGLFVGSAGLSLAHQPPASANLGYWVRRSWHRRGAATAAIRQAARFALVTLGLQRVEILAAEGNVASRAAALRAGAKQEGVLRRRLLMHGTMRDAVVFSLTVDELEPAAA